MTLIARDCLAQARHALSGDPSGIVGGLWLVNACGEAHVSAHAWRYLERTASLDFVQDQNYVGLPTDFAALRPRGIWFKGYPIIETSIQEVLALRQGSGAAQTFRVAIGYAPASGSTPPLPRLELDHTPSADETAALTIAYRAGWVPITDDGAYLPIPTWLELPFIGLVRATAEGLELDEGMPAAQERLATFLAGPLWSDAKRRDMAIQSAWGPLRGGQVRGEAQGLRGSLWPPGSSVTLPS